MAEQQVCNINFYYYICFIFGFNHDVGPSRRTRWLAALYRLIVLVFISTYTYMYYKIVTPDDVYFASVLISEYLAYVMISMISKNEYLQQYYKTIRIIDDISNTRMYKILQVCLITNVAMILFCKISVHTLFYYVDWVFEGNRSAFTFVYEIIIYLAVVFGRLPCVFVFSLLYCRVRCMRTRMERNEFKCTSLGDHHPRTYIQMYETIMDSFEKTDNPVKFQLFISNVLSMMNYFPVSLYVLQHIKKGTIEPFYTLWTLSDLIMACMPMVISAILSDLVIVEMQEMLSIVVERRIKTKNEREYAEIQKLFELMKSRPYNYTVWGVIPLNLRSLLTFSSFFITTIIAILQIKNFNN